MAVNQLIMSEVQWHPQVGATAAGAAHRAMIAPNSVAPQVAEERCGATHGAGDEGQNE